STGIEWWRRRRLGTAELGGERRERAGVVVRAWLSGGAGSRAGVGFGGSRRRVGAAGLRGSEIEVAGRSFTPAGCGIELGSRFLNQEGMRDRGSSRFLSQEGMRDRGIVSIFEPGRHAGPRFVSVFEPGRHAGPTFVSFLEPGGHLRLTLGPFARALASEIDHLPFGSVRGRWSVEALARADGEIERITESAREEVLVACRHLVERFGGSGAV